MTTHATHMTNVASIFINIFTFFYCGFRKLHFVTIRANQFILFDVNRQILDNIRI